MREIETSRGRWHEDRGNPLSRECLRNVRRAPRDIGKRTDYKVRCAEGASTACPRAKANRGFIDVEREEHHPPRCCKESRGHGGWWRRISASRNTRRGGSDGVAGQVVRNFLALLSRNQEVLQQFIDGRDLSRFYVARAAASHRSSMNPQGSVGGNATAWGNLR